MSDDPLTMGKYVNRLWLKMLRVGALQGKTLPVTVQKAWPFCTSSWTGLTEYQNFAHLFRNQA